MGRVKLNLIGKTFTYLTVVKYLGRSNWLCECRCGKIYPVLGVYLRNGKTKSCGCRKLRSIEESFETGINRFITFNIKNNKELSLTREEIKTLIFQNCTYCGLAPLQKMKLGNKKVVFLHNGIDRVDSSKGYIPGNCVAACKWCNYAKWTLNQKEFIEWLENLTENFSTP